MKRLGCAWQDRARLNHNLVFPGGFLDSLLAQRPRHSVASTLLFSGKPVTGLSRDVPQLGEGLPNMPGPGVHSLGLCKLGLVVHTQRFPQAPSLHASQSTFHPASCTGSLHTTGPKDTSNQDSSTGSAGGRPILTVTLWPVSCPSTWSLVFDGTASSASPLKGRASLTSLPSPRFTLQTDSSLMWGS